MQSVGRQVTGTVNVRISCAGRTREMVFRGESLRIGSDNTNGLVLPFSWVRPKHLLVQQDAGIARVRVFESGIPATLNGQPIGTAGIMLPPGGVVEIWSPSGDSLSLQFIFHKASKGAVLADEREAHVHIAVPAAIVGISPLDEVSSVFQPTAQASVPRPVKQSRRPKDNKLVVAMALLAMFMLIGGAVAWTSMTQSRRTAAWRVDLERVQQSVKTAQDMIHQGQYVEAKSTIDQGLHIAAGRQVFAEYTDALNALTLLPEIKYGAAGYVLMQSQWLPHETATAWKMAMDRDNPQIQALQDSATKALTTGKDVEIGLRDCETALALMAAEPVHPHPMLSKISGLRDDLKNQSIAAEMTAKGFVLYDRKWVTTEERFRLTQLSLGLVEYKGKWLRKADAFAAEQTDKGLVLFAGKWMTPDEERIAQGFVNFEGEWITVAQKQEILTKRAEAERLEREQEAQKQRAAEAEAERQRQALAAIEAAKPDAYAMSQEFVKDILKSPTSAQFQPYTSARVTVVYSEGWYLVSGVVDAQNGFGAMLRKSYICKLRPVAGQKWQAENTFLLDN